MQRAFQADQLPQVAAERVARLDKKKQLEIAGRIEAGENPKQVVAEYLRRTVSWNKTEVLRGFVGRIVTAAESVENLVDELPVAGPSYVAALQNARRTIDRILRRAKQPPQKP